MIFKLKINSLFSKIIVTTSMVVMLSACGGPPDDVVENAISNNEPYIHSLTYSLDGWKETNSYTKKRNDETLYVVEYTGSGKISPQIPMNLRNGTDEVKFNGQVSLVKRGNSWYSIK